jgi:hypothetical protein
VQEASAEQTLIAPRPWLIRAGFGLGFLESSIHDTEQARVGKYSSNPNMTVSGALGYQGLVLGASIGVGNVLSSETHGVSRGFTLAAAYPLRVFDRELVISGVAQNYRGMFQVDPDASSAGNDNEGPISIEKLLRSYLYQVSSTLYLNRNFSFEEMSTRVSRRKFVGSWHVGLAYAAFGARNAAPLALYDPARRTLVTDEGAMGVRSLDARSLSLPIGGQAYAVEQTRWYALFGGYAGPALNQGRADDGALSRLRLSGVLGFGVGAGYTADWWHTGLTADLRIHSLHLAEASLFLVSGVVGSELGVLF